MSPILHHAATLPPSPGTSSTLRPAITTAGPVSRKTGCEAGPGGDSDGSGHMKCLSQDLVPGKHSAKIAIVIIATYMHVPDSFHDYKLIEGRILINVTLIHPPQ